MRVLLLLVLLISTLLLTGCKSFEQYNEEINLSNIKVHKQCVEAGMTSEYNESTGLIYCVGNN
jgi:hypothetical protein